MHTVYQQFTSNIPRPGAQHTRSVPATHCERARNTYGPRTEHVRSISIISPHITCLTKNGQDVPDNGQGKISFPFFFNI